MSSPSVAGQRTEHDAEHRRGVLFGVTAYGIWGLFPLYWALLSASGALETLAHRMIWSLVVVAGVLLWTRRFGTFRAVLRNRRQLLLLTAAAVLIATNWGVYIWGVNSGHVVETALGYFIGPLVSVLLGVVLLGERLRKAQWTAVALGVVAVVVLAVGYGELPWIALVLACSFATYGLVKKLANVGAVESMAVETSVTLLPALAFVVFLEASGNGTFTTGGVGHALLLVGGGFVTMVPLLAFGAAAVRIPLSVIGLLQYLTPSLQFTFGVLVFREHMPPERWLGFAFVWLALIVLTFDGLRRRTPPAIEPEPLP
ncbi:EamA family transporter RarD [Actinophytocola glycyrrhizae]|uniref:EamA family transporter RarD n=1 Tax=Actinophytocola glycyrrhizae TaxID=2044873 RepID=A0ABV9S0D1_9PSEU